MALHRRLGPAVLVVLLVAALALVTVETTRRPPEELPRLAPPPPEGYDPGLAGFVVRAGRYAIPYRVFALFVRPREAVPLAVTFAGTGVEARARVEAAGGALAPAGPGRWRWTAPDSAGLYPLTVTDRRTGRTVTLNAFVMVPFDHADERLDGYRIGRYQAEPLGGKPAYARPDWFVRVTPEVVDTPVSPHFRLGQFVAKQEAPYPKYLVLQERLLLKLERLLRAVNAAGVEAETFAVLSGYRTPHYNAAIGNTTLSSRHLYGDAADFYIDEDGDGQMDDLDGDGEVTVADADSLAALVEAQASEAWYRPFVGGLGIYAPAPHRGPFVHVDTRGEAVRWRE